MNKLNPTTIKYIHEKKNNSQTDTKKESSEFSINPEIVQVSIAAIVVIGVIVTVVGFALANGISKEIGHGLAGNIARWWILNS